MQVEHHFFLPITPNAAQRTRATCRGRFAQVYQDPKYKEWLAEAVSLLRDIASTEDFREYSGSPVSIKVEVAANRPKTTKLIAPRYDVDNLEKGLWDAITTSGKWWEDDRQIIESHTHKRWARDGEAEGYYVTITFLDGLFSK